MKKHLLLLRVRSEGPFVAKDDSPEEREYAVSNSWLELTVSSRELCEGAVLFDEYSTSYEGIKTKVSILGFVDQPVSEIGKSFSGRDVPEGDRLVEIAKSLL